MKRSDKQEAAVLIALGIVGVIQMLFQPRKTYNLIVHNKSWY